MFWNIISTISDLVFLKLTVNMKCFEIAMAGMKTNEVLEINRKHEMFWNFENLGFKAPIASN